MSDSNSAKLRGLLMLASTNTPAPEAPHELIPWRPDMPGIPPPAAAVAVLAPLDPSQESVVDSIGYHSRQIYGVPWVRHAPLPVSALAAHGAVAASSSQTLAARAVAAALPGIQRTNGPVTPHTAVLNVATQDNVVDGVSFGRVQNTELSGNTVKQLNDGVHVRNAASAAAAHDAVGNLLLKNIASAVGTTASPNQGSSTYAVVPEMSITANFKGNPVLLNFSGTFLITGSGSGAFQNKFAIFKDGSQLTQDYGSDIPTDELNFNFGVAITFIDTPTAGSHTYDVRWAYSGVGTAHLQGGSSLASGKTRSLQVVELG